MIIDELALFRRNLKYLREVNKLQQSELDGKLKLGVGSICNYEIGRAKPNIITFSAICDFFGTTAEVMTKHDIEGQGGLHKWLQRNLEAEGGGGSRVLNYYIDLAISLNRRVNTQEEYIRELLQEITELDGNRNSEIS